MRFVFLACGFLGFALVAIGGFTADRAADLVLRDAALGCLAAALLGRWFWTVLVRALEQTVAARRAAEIAASEAATAPVPAAAPRTPPAGRPALAAPPVSAAARGR